MLSLSDVTTSIQEEYWCQSRFFAVAILQINEGSNGEGEGGLIPFPARILEKFKGQVYKGKS